MFAAYLISRGAGVEEAIARAATVTRDDQRAFLVGLAAGLPARADR
jgi:hypothetical protein